MERFGKHLLFSFDFVGYLSQAQHNITLLFLSQHFNFIIIFLINNNILGLHCCAWCGGHCAQLAPARAAVLHTPALRRWAVAYAVALVLGARGVAVPGPARAHNFPHHPTGEALARGKHHCQDQIINIKVSSPELHFRFNFQ